MADEIEFVDATDPERGVLAFLSAMGAGDLRCDIRGCEAAGNHRFYAEDGSVVDLCDLHSTIIEALPRAASPPGAGSSNVKGER